MELGGSEEVVGEHGVVENQDAQEGERQRGQERGTGPGQNREPSNHHPCSPLFVSSTDSCPRAELHRSGGKV